VVSAFVDLFFHTNVDTTHVSVSGKMMVQLAFGEFASSTNVDTTRLVGSLVLQASFAEYRLFYRALLQNIVSFISHPIARDAVAFGEFNKC